MKIIVSAKQVPDTSGKVAVNPDGTLDRASMQAISRIGVEKDDIVMCGRQPIDGDTAQVGPQIAEKLHLPQVTYAADIQKTGNTITVKPMLEDGYMTIKVKTPCLLTCIKELNTPRYMSVGGIVGGPRATIDSGWLSAEHQVGQTGKTPRCISLRAFPAPSSTRPSCRTPVHHRGERRNAKIVHRCT